MNISKLLFLPQKASFHAEFEDAEFYGELNGATFIFLYGIFCQKTNFKILHMDIFKAFGRHESHFRTGCLEIWHIPGGPDKMLPIKSAAID